MKHQEPTEAELAMIKPISITQGELPWKPGRFNDDEGSNFFQDVAKLDAEDEEAIDGAVAQQVCVEKQVPWELSISLEYCFGLEDDEIYYANHFNTTQMSVYSNGIFNLDNDEAWYLGEMTTSHCNSLVVDECLQLTPDDINNDFNPEIRLAKPEPKAQSMSRAIPKRVDITKLVRNFAYRPADIIKHTLRHTTQLATSVISFPLRRHFMSRFRFLRKRRLKETIATDTYFSKIKSLEGYWCAQVFFGVESKMIKVEGMKSESDFLTAYLDFIRKHGIPPVLHRDNAKAER